MGNNAKNNEKKQWKRGSKRDNRGGRELPGPRGPFIVGRASPISGISPSGFVRAVLRTPASFAVMPAHARRRRASTSSRQRRQKRGGGDPLRLLRKVRAPQRTRPVLNDILAARATIGKNKK